MRLTRNLTIVFAAVILTACGGAATEFENSSQIADEIRQAKAATPLPPGATWDEADLKPKAGASYQAGYFEVTIEAQAQCKWYIYWLGGFGAHDDSKTSAAESMFPKMHVWRLYVSADDSYRQLVDSIEAKAELGDPTGLKEFVRLNCGGASQSPAAN